MVPSRKSGHSPLTSGTTGDVAPAGAGATSATGAAPGTPPGAAPGIPGAGTPPGPAGVAPGAPGAAAGTGGAAAGAGTFLGITMLIAMTGEAPLAVALACGPTTRPVLADEPAADAEGSAFAGFNMDGPVTWVSDPQAANTTRPSHRALVRSVVIFQPFEESLHQCRHRARSMSKSYRGQPNLNKPCKGRTTATSLLEDCTTSTMQVINAVGLSSLRRWCVRSPVAANGPALPDRTTLSAHRTRALTNEYSFSHSSYSIRPTPQNATHPQSGGLHHPEVRPRAPVRACPSLQVRAPQPALAQLA
jgi:hypothetical protein